MRKITLPPPPSLKGLNPAIFEAAAANLLSGKDDCCCWALYRAIHGNVVGILGNSNPHIFALLEWFRPDPKIESLEFQPAYYWRHGSKEECLEQRVLALLTLAAMTRAERAPKSPGLPVSASSVPSDPIAA